MLSYTRHAKERMRQRAVTEEEVQYCLEKFEVSYPDRAGNSIYKVTLQNGRRIKVVVKANSFDPVIIITVGD